jgi:AcrR family transcriptional regulator
MPGTRTYRSRGRTARSQETRARIMAAVRELLTEGTFHESSVEQVADRAGVSRATLYQHFPSRVDLVDSICYTLGSNPALVAIREAVRLDDVEDALVQTVELSVRFWSSEDAVLSQLYDVAAVDAGARAFVERQRSDRRSEIERLARNLAIDGRLPTGVTRPQAVAQLMVLTSYDAFRELRLAGLSDREIAKTLTRMARELLLPRS